MEKTYHTVAGALRGLAADDPHAFRWIYDKYYDAVTAVGHKYLQDAALTEQLVQEIFSSLWIRRTQLAGVDHFETYFLTLVRNLAVQHIKRKASEALGNKMDPHLKPATENNVETYAQDYELALKRMGKQMDSHMA